MQTQKALSFLLICSCFSSFLHAQEQSFNSPDKRTTFWNAIHTKKASIIGNIVKNDITEKNKTNWASDINDALLVIAASGLNDILVLILNNTTTKNLIHSESAYAALICAVNNKHYNVAEMLLKDDTICAQFTIKDIQSIIDIAQDDWPQYLTTLLNKALANKSKN